MDKYFFVNGHLWLEPLPPEPEFPAPPCFLWADACDALNLLTPLITA
jgi:hypothetical protein